MGIIILLCQPHVLKIKGSSKYNECYTLQTGQARQPLDKQVQLKACFIKYSDKSK